MGDFNLSPITCDLTPLVQGVSNGTGKVLSLLFGKKIAKAEAVKKLIAAQAERQSRLLLEGKATLDENSNFIDYEKIAEDNINQCIELAVNETMYRDNEPSDEDISMTFFNKWREHAKTIDEPHLKQLWSKILVDEIYTPNSISLRVLNTLSMLSTNEANLFVNSMKYMINNEAIISDLIPENQRDKILENLFSIGAISEMPNKGFRFVTGLNFFFDGEYKCFHFPQQMGKLCVIFKTIQKKDDGFDDITFQITKLTSVGRTLYNLAYSYNEKSSIELIESINKNMLETSNVQSISLYRIENGNLGYEIFSKQLI